jgi:hypothetical protein
MGETRYIEFSDAAIRAEAKDKDVRDLPDKRYPDMRFRFLKDRRRGAWYTVHGARWQMAEGGGLAALWLQGIGCAEVVVPAAAYQWCLSRRHAVRAVYGR